MITSVASVLDDVVVEISKSYRLRLVANLITSPADRVGPICQVLCFSSFVCSPCPCCSPPDSLDQHINTHVLLDIRWCGTLKSLVWWFQFREEYLGETERPEAGAMMPYDIAESLAANVDLAEVQNTEVVGRPAAKSFQTKLLPERAIEDQRFYSTGTAQYGIACPTLITGVFRGAESERHCVVLPGMGREV